MPLTAPMIASEIPAAIRPYSMAVAPDSSFRKRAKSLDMSKPPVKAKARPWQPRIATQLNQLIKSDGKPAEVNRRPSIGAHPHRVRAPVVGAVHQQAANA